MNIYLLYNSDYYKFETIELPGPKDYNFYLTQMYGDYMTLPPIEKQVTHHAYKVYWK